MLHVEVSGSINLYIVLHFKLKKMILNAEFWDSRYKSNQIGWDLGEVSPPIKEYIDQLKDKSIRILIPGAGNAYEAEYLLEKGFKNVFIVDFAKNALDSFSLRNSTFPKEQLLCLDFFELNDSFDLILEQTFFCAIDPALRTRYVKKMIELLTENARLVGVLFNRSFESGPPFGGDLEEYKTLFTPFFKDVKIEKCYNSVAPRLGSELFINFLK